MTYEIGIGMYDCTGPAAEQVMMGYSDTEQETQGIGDRQWVRAFIIKDKQGNLLCYAIADICMVFQAVKVEVARRLSDKYDGALKSENVMLSGTHTHSGPGGYSHHFAYNLACHGYNEQTFEVIVNGFIQAIDRAWNNIRSADIFITQGELLHCGGQRSREAWESNPIEERELYGDTDKSFTMLKFIDTSGKIFGMINYFALHATSRGMFTHLISSDCKGLASRLLERKFGNNPYEDDPGFIAAFPNSNCGDVSPNVGLGIPPGGEEDFSRMVKFGTKLYNKALELVDLPSEQVTGDLRYNQTYVDMSNVQIEGTEKKTCVAAFGASYTGASSEDSYSPMPMFPEGLNKSEFDSGEVTKKESIVNKVLTSLLDIVWNDMDDPEWAKCQGEKPIFLPLGMMKYLGQPFVPYILPVQLFKLGTVSIAGFPGEITSIAGIRLKNSILNILKEIGVRNSLISAYSNAYASYTTTKEEYDQQHYEGAGTLFGPNQLQAYQQEFGKIAQKLVNSEEIDPGEPIPDISDNQKMYKLKVMFDDDKMGTDYGDVLSQPNPEYLKGEIVEVKFVGAHPRNNLRTMDTFLEIQKKSEDDWVTVYRDFDYETEYHWKRKGIAQSEIKILWRIPSDERIGEYRITHHGDAKSGWTGKIEPYTGSSNSFIVS